MATPIPGREAVDLGNGTALTEYTDGSRLVWDITSGQQVSYQPAPAGAATASTQQYPYLGTYPASMGGQTVAPSNPWTIGAGTAGIQYGYGVPRPGADLIKINPSYLDFLGTQATGQRGGYIPGSGSYLGWQLDKPGLLATIGGTPNMLTTWGSGAVGDPAGVAGQPQTPQQWVQAPRLFTWEGMMTGAQGPIASLFGRSDTPSGISTDALNAPQPYWQELYTQIASGRVQPSAAGWQFLQQIKGITPQQIGGAAPQQAQKVGAGGDRVTDVHGAGPWSDIAGGDQQLANVLANIAASQGAEAAARLAYSTWQMRTGDETLAMNKAQQAWTQTYTQQQADRAQALAAAGLTGQYEGQQTQQAQQQAFNQDLANRQFGLAQQGQQAQTGLGLLGLQSSLQGPSSWLKYAQLNQNTPQGLKDMLAGFAGQYNFAGSASQGTPGPATLATRTQDLLAPTAGAGAPSGAAGAGPFALPSPNQLSLQNWANASPTQQQMLLGTYSGAGYNPDDVVKALAAAAPRYTGPSAATVR